MSATELPLPQPSSEFRALVACCRQLFDDAARPEIAGLVSMVPSTDLFALAHRHRVEGLLWRALSIAGLDMASADFEPLAAAARRVSQSGLRAAAASKQLQTAFASVRIDLLFLKGLALGQLAFRDPFVKMSWDIDILVAKTEVGPAADVLEGLGYHLVYPPGGAERARLAQWHARRKESTWTNGSGIFIELHSRLADSDALIPSIGLDSPRQRVEIVKGITLETFATVPLFAYLCVHGASSAWFRLKWVADLAGLLAPMDGHTIEGLYAEAVDLGAGRAAAQALLVVDRLFGLPLDDRLRHRLLDSRANRLLVRAALRQLFSPAEPTERRFGTVGIHASQWLLMPGARFALGEARRQIATALTNRSAD